MTSDSQMWNGTQTSTRCLGQWTMPSTGTLVGDWPSLNALPQRCHGVLGCHKSHPPFPVSIQNESLRCAVDTLRFYLRNPLTVPPPQRRPASSLVFSEKLQANPSFLSFKTLTFPLVPVITQGSPQGPSDLHTLTVPRLEASTQRAQDSSSETTEGT